MAKKKQRTLVCGDIHGGAKALLQCLDRSKFDYEKDRLISLGDENDGWRESYQVIEELMKIKNFISCLGNHTFWLLQWLEYGVSPEIWVRQGGQATIDSYIKSGTVESWKKHRDFISKFPYYFIDEENRCFVHGGVKQDGTPITETDNNFLMWDRELWINRHNLKEIKEFKEVFVGHTSTWNISKFPPHHANVYFLDQGGGYEGKLTIMDVDTKEFWQSDRVSTLYPGYSHR
jgi:serine/threonine protein phosphatase 1